MRLIHPFMKESTLILEFFELHSVNILIYSIVKRIVDFIQGNRRKIEKDEKRRIED
jgi:hypothetical protein